MKLFALSILYKGSTGILLKGAYDLSAFGFFQKTSVQEFMRFTSVILVERSAVCSRSSIKENEYMCHVNVRADSLAGVLIADHEYPQRVAFTLINKVLDDFASKVHSSSWPTANERTVSFVGLEIILQKYQNPREADAMMKIEADLDETKIILHDTLEALLQRGEKLEDLVDRSTVLSDQSKLFYKTAKKTNQCCVVL